MGVAISGIGMWYVIQTLKGKELKNTENIRRNVAEDNEKIFVIENEKMFRIRGEWIIDRKPLFPGYIFVTTDNTNDFNKRLYKNRMHLKLLEVDGVVTPIREEEEEYLKILGGEEHIVRFSQGYRVGDKVEITSGAFAGFEGEIRKLDRHNRRARLCLRLMGKDIEVEIGLGIVESIR